jgi:hypothetical protein
MSHDSPETPLGGRSTLCLARACPRAIQEILVSSEVPSSRNDSFRLARAHLGYEDNPEPSLS